MPGEGEAGTGTNTTTDVTQLASLGTDNPSGSGVSVAQSDIYSAWADPAVMEQWEWMPFDDPYAGVLGAGVDDPAVIRARAQAKAQVEAEMTDQEYANTRSQEEIARIKAGLDDRFTFDQYRQARGYTAEQLEASMAQDDPVSVQGGGPEVPEEKLSMAYRPRCSTICRPSRRWATWARLVPRSRGAPSMPASSSTT
jgi:hypothetical protein